MSFNSSDPFFEEYQEQPKKKGSETPKKELNPVKFNIKTLIHYLNTCYGENYLFKDSAKLAELDEEKRKNKTVIDISEYTALEDFKKIINTYNEKPKVLGEKEAVKTKKDKKNNKQVPKEIKETEKWNNIAHSVTDFKLRGILAVIGNSREKNEKEKMYELLMNHIIPQLGYDKSYVFDKEKIKEAIIDFLKSEKIKFKLFNRLFPHPDIIPTDSSKKESHLNKLYLQNVSAYHSKYISALFEEPGNTDFEKLFKIACEEIAKNSDNNTITTSYLMKYNWDEYDTRKFAKEESETLLPFLKLAHAERNLVKKYIEYVSICKQQKDISSKALGKIYKNYNSSINTFASIAKKVEKQKLNSIQDFIEMFVGVFRELNEPLHYRNIYTTFVKDIGFNKKLVFTQRFKHVLNMLIKNPLIKVTYVDNTFKDVSVSYEIKTKDNKTKTIEKKLEGAIIQNNKYSPNIAYNTFGKIGIYFENNNIRIRKDIKVAIGIAIVDYIKTECDKVFITKKLSSKKPIKKTIYIKQ